MEKQLLSILLLAILVTGCKNRNEQTVEEKPGLMDATRNFIRSALDGKYNEARKYMLIDSANVQYLNTAEGFYTTLDKSAKESFAAASILIHSKEEKIKDSIAVVVYSNSYKHNQDTLRLVKINNQWLVDLKYLYEHDYDTLMMQVRKDTIR